MNWGSPEFVIAIIAICVGGGIINSWIRAKHGYPIEDDNGNLLQRSNPEDGRKIELLSSENEQLVGKIDQLQERLQVLERIATDPAKRTADEIEALREKS
jgi:hypothetical protein